eukprot:5902504-Pyramimonas_sp.AAC.1
MASRNSRGRDIYRHLYHPCSVSTPRYPSGDIGRRNAALTRTALINVMSVMLYNTMICASR